MTGFSSFAAVFLLLCLLSCSGEKSSGTAPQGPSESGAGGEIRKTGPELTAPSARAGYSLELAPPDASRKSTLYLMPKGFILSDAKAEWLVNGSPVTTQPPNQLKAAELKKGDKVQARATLKSGETISSNIVQIKNGSPELRTAKIMPEVFKRGDTLSIDATAMDIDGDVVVLSYEWSRNGEPAGNSSRMEGQIKRGDKIAVKITPFDGEAYGRPLILQRDVTNMPPMILEDKRFNFDGKVWTYQIKATDPDGDPLTYSLKSAPEGMTIGATTGFIKWNVPPQFVGKAPVTVSVTDGHGGESTYNFNVDMTLTKTR